VAITPEAGRPWLPGPLTVLLLAAALLAWNLWGYDLWAPDEPYFGEGAREMVVDGHWLVPHVNGEVTTDKPPLFFWLIALFSLPAGRVSSWTARLPSLLAALGALALTMRLARRWWGAETAAAAGIFLTTMTLFWRQARSAQIDALLCLLILVSLSAFEAFRAGEARGRPAGLLFWAAAAAATLAKGPVGLLIPLLIALLTLALDRDLRSWRRFAPLAGPALFLVLAGSWAAATLRAGSEYSVFDALRRHFLERALHGMHHVQPPWYYLTTLPVGLLPWTGLAAAGLVLAWRERRDPRMRFLLAWSLGVVVMFSLATEKRDLYLLPTLPAFALLAAGFIAALAGREEPGGRVPSRGWITISLGGLGALLAAVGAGLPVAAAGHAAKKLPLDLTGTGWMLAAVLVPGGLVLLLLSLRKRWRAAVAAMAVTVSLVYLLVQTVVFPALEPIKSVRRFAVELKGETAGYRAAGNRVLTFGLGNVPRAISFYSGGVYLREVTRAEDLERALAGPAPVYAAVDRKALAALPAPVRGRLGILATTSMADQEIVLVRSGPALTPDPF
jgi:4-amino-4-deoxy-L-arabinose transferase-like glycosyltransferase